MLYAAGFTAFGKHVPALEQWIGATRPIVDTALLFIHPGASRDVEPGLLINRHVLLVTVVLTAGWISFGRRWLADWGEDFVAAYRQSHDGACPSRAWLEEAHGVSTLGAFGTVYLLLFDPTQNSWARSYPAAVYVVPLLSVIAFYLICRAMVFHRLAEPPLG
jgi:hypothetical protein